MLDKAIEHGKEHRKPYYHSGRVDLTCRPHGGCPWCERNRLKNKELQNEDVQSRLEEVDELIDIMDHGYIKEGTK